MNDNSKKTAVIYRSKYGNTKRYAEWIAQQLGADLYESSKIKADALSKYDVIIFGGSLHAVGILGLPFICKNFDKIASKKTIVFSVGASPAHPEAMKHVKEVNLPGEIGEKVNYFHLRGGFNYKKLDMLDKILMNMLRRKIEKKLESERSEDENGLLETFKTPADWKIKEAISPIVQCALSNE